MRSRRARSPIVPTRSEVGDAQPAARPTVRRSGRAIASRRDRRDVVDDPAVEHRDPPGRAGGDLAVVGDQHDRAARCVELGEQVRRSRRRCGCRGCRSARRRARSPGRRRGPGRWRPAGARRPTAAPGRWPARSASPTASSASRGSAQPLPPAGTPAYSRPSATFSSAVSRSTRWNCWNTNPMRRPRTADSRPSRSVLDVVAVDAHGARRRSLQGADDVQQRRLARARRADDDDELAAADRRGRRRRAPAPAGCPGTPWSTPTELEDRGGVPSTSTGRQLRRRRSIVTSRHDHLSPAATSPVDLD